MNTLLIAEFVMLIFGIIITVFSEDNSSSQKSGAVIITIACSLIGITSFLL